MVLSATDLNRCTKTHVADGLLALQEEINKLFRILFLARV
jgi:hypothetical protein